MTWIDDDNFVSRVRDFSKFSHRFFEDLDSHQGKNFDNYVSDVTVPYSLNVGRRYESDISEDTVDENNLFDHFEEDDFNQPLEGYFKYKFVSIPDSRITSIGELEENSDVYIPNITRDCLRNSPDSVYSSNNFIDAIEEESEKLEVKAEMDISEYSANSLENTQMDKDDAIIEAAENLDGSTCILTYNDNFLSRNIDATIPEIAAILHDN